MALHNRMARDVQMPGMAPINAPPDLIDLFEDAKMQARYIEEVLDREGIYSIGFEANGSGLWRMRGSPDAAGIWQKERDVASRLGRVAYALLDVNYANIARETERVTPIEPSEFVKRKLLRRFM